MGAQTVWRNRVDVIPHATLFLLSLAFFSLGYRTSLEMYLQPMYMHQSIKVKSVFNLVRTRYGISP